MEDEQYINIEDGLSVGAVKYADPNEIFTEEELNNIKNKVPELDEKVGVINDEIKEINSSLDNNTKLLSKGGSYNYNGAVVTFIDDDGYLTFLERWKPLCDSKGIKICIGAITSKVGQTGRMTLDQLKALKLEGFEILNHTVSHPDTRTCTMEKWEQECVESKDYMLKNGLNDNQVIVYSKGFYGEYTEEQKTNIKNVTRKHFKYAVNSTGSNNPIIYDNMCLARREADNKSFDVLKQAVDTANADNTWLIILTHCNNAFKEDVLSQLIDYIQGLNIPILTFSEAEKIKGYDLYVGDYLDEDKKVILKSKDYVLPIKNELLISVEYQKPYDFDKSITEYELDKITYVAVDYKDDIHFSKGGVLETFRGKKNYSYQIYYMANVNVIAKRTWNETNSNWNKFIIINGILRKNTTPTSEFDVNNINLFVINNSSDITEINHFINGVEFQEVSILNKLSSITIKSNVSGTGEIRCKGGTDLVLAPNDMANFLNVGGIWYQK